MSYTDSQRHVLTFSHSAGGAANITLCPHGWLLDDDRNVFLGAGEIYSVECTPTLPANSVIQVIDYRDDDGELILGGSGTADPSLDFGQFGVEGGGILDTNGAAGVAAQVVVPGLTAEGPNPIITGDPAIYGSIFTLTGPNTQVLVHKPGAVSVHEGRVLCANGMLVRLVLGAAWTGTVRVDVRAMRQGKDRLKTFRSRVRSFRQEAITGITTGATTQLELGGGAAVQMVPIGSEFTAVVSGSPVAGSNGIWKGLVAEALSGGGDFIVRLPMTSAGAPAPAGSVQVVWPNAETGRWAS